MSDLLNYINMLVNTHCEFVVSSYPTSSTDTMIVVATFDDETKTVVAHHFEQNTRGIQRLTCVRTFTGYESLSAFLADQFE